MFIFILFVTGKKANKLNEKRPHVYFCTKLNECFSADIYDHLDSSLEDIGLTCECLGGGKIEHNAEAKTINVFGLSQVGLKQSSLGECVSST